MAEIAPGIIRRVPPSSHVRVVKPQARTLTAAVNKPGRREQRRTYITQNAGHNAGGVNKARDKSADKTRRDEPQRRDTEAKPLDPGTRTWWCVQRRYRQNAPLNERKQSCRASTSLVRPGDGMSTTELDRGDQSHGLSRTEPVPLSAVLWVRRYRRRSLRARLASTSSQNLAINSHLARRAQVGAQPACTGRHEHRPERSLTIERCSRRLFIDSA
jgi:hypothetical protein